VIPVAVGFASISEVALRIFGPAYVAGFIPSVIVSLATGLTAVVAVSSKKKLAMGELKWFTGANVIGLGGLAVVAFVATPVFGLSGPALGRASLMVLAALVYAYATMRSGFFEFDVKAFLGAAGSSFLMGAVVFFALSIFHTFLFKLAMLPVVVVVGGVNGRPLQPTFPRTLRLKFGHVKHSTNETFFSLTGQSTASFFIRASILPLTAPLIASSEVLGLGMAFGGAKMSTRYLSSAPS